MIDCPMCGRAPHDEDAWLYKKWKTEVNVDSLRQATLPPGPVQDKVYTYEALVLASSLSELSNRAPSLSDEEDSPTGLPSCRMPAPWSKILEQDTVAPFTLPKIAMPSDAGISKEEDIAIPVSVARKVIRLSMFWEGG